jgi:hypothetical protein
VVIEVLFNIDLHLYNLSPMLRKNVPAPTPRVKKSKHKLPTPIEQHGRRAKISPTRQWKKISQKNSIFSTHKNNRDILYYWKVLQYIPFHVKTYVRWDILDLRTSLATIHCNQNTLSPRNKDEDVTHLSLAKKKKLSKFLACYKIPQDITNLSFQLKEFQNAKSPTVR